VGCGTVFKVDSNGTETVLFSFPVFGGSDGSLPVGGLIRDSEGNLYGMTETGGHAVLLLWSTGRLRCSIRTLSLR
jgi:hypothetical protein